MYYYDTSFERTHYTFAVLNMQQRLPTSALQPMIMVVPLRYL